MRSRRELFFIGESSSILSEYFSATNRVLCRAKHEPCEVCLLSVYRFPQAHHETERVSESGMHEQTELVEMCTTRHNARKFFVDTAEDGPFNVAPSRGACAGAATARSGHGPHSRYSKRYSVKNTFCTRENGTALNTPNQAPSLFAQYI